MSVFNPYALTPYHCDTCGLTLYADPAQTHCCVAYHGEGVCCHLYSYLRTPDGLFVRAPAPPGCEVIELQTTDCSL